MKDLALLVADKDMELALQAALRRPESLSVRPFTFTCIKHPERDGGVRSNGASVLSVMASSHSHALLVLDFEGSGATGLTVEALESRLDAEMQPVWKDRGKSIVIAPELDVWMWGNDDLLRDVYGWREDSSMRDWLSSRDFALDPNGKPERPKEAIQAVMRKMRRPRSSALYGEIAGRISLARCVDPAFVRLREQLQRWFPPTPGRAT